MKDTHLIRDLQCNSDAIGRKGNIYDRAIAEILFLVDRLQNAHERIDVLLQKQDDILDEKYK